jgi:hypothetical protein
MQNVYNAVEMKDARGFGQGGMQASYTAGKNSFFKNRQLFSPHLALWVSQ